MTRTPKKIIMVLSLALVGAWGLSYCSDAEAWGWKKISFKKMWKTAKKHANTAFHHSKEAIKHGKKAVALYKEKKAEFHEFKTKHADPFLKDVVKEMNKIADSHDSLKGLHQDAAKLERLAKKYNFINDAKKLDAIAAKDGYKPKVVADLKNVLKDMQKVEDVLNEDDIDDMDKELVKGHMNQKIQADIDTLGEDGDEGSDFYDLAMEEAGKDPFAKTS